jgi:hypothetical protein
VQPEPDRYLAGAIHCLLSIKQPIVQSGRPPGGNESGTAGICKIYIPSLKGKNAFERRDFYFVRFSGADKL